MVMKLDEAVPFGRSLDEYRRMFALSDADLQSKILGVGDGPASFNAEMASQGKTVVSVDPLYRFHAEEIERRFYAVVEDIIAQVEATPEDWVWSFHKSPGDLRQYRVAVLRRFLADYAAGLVKQRYVLGELPKLAFHDNQFDIALCSHFLFLYSDHFDGAFHQASIFEMLRVASEVRIFPLLTLMLAESPYLPRLCRELEDAGFRVSVEEVDYEIQRGGNQMLRIRRSA